MSFSIEVIMFFYKLRIPSLLRCDVWWGVSEEGTSQGPFVRSPPGPSAEGEGQSFGSTAALCRPASRRGWAHGHHRPRGVSHGVGTVLPDRKVWSRPSARMVWTGRAEAAGPRALLFAVSALHFYWKPGAAEVQPEKHCQFWVAGEPTKHQSQYTLLPWNLGKKMIQPHRYIYIVILYFFYVVKTKIVIL